MRKEVIIAICIGSLIGIAGAYLSLGQKKPKEVEPQSTQTTVKDTKPKQTSFAIESPVINTAVSDTQVTITGVADANSLVVIDTPTNTVLATRDDTSFTTKVAVVEGVNRIAVLQIGAQTVSIARDLLMIPGTHDLVTKSGSITDITEGGMQIRQDNGEVSTIKTSNETKYKNNSKTLKDIKSTEVAIGDVVYLAGRMVDKTYFADWVYVTTLAAGRAAPVQASVSKTTSKEITISTDQGDKAYTLANYTVYSVNKTALTKIKTPVTGRRVIILPSSILVLDEGQ